MSYHKNFKISKLLLSLFILIAFSASLYAEQICKSYVLNQWQDSRYEDHGNGTVTDKVTKLMWKKCSQGQTWDNTNNTNTCTGNTTEMNWKTALENAKASTFASYTNWKVPNIKELNSLVALNCASPAINENLFPNTPSNSFWTSSPYSSYSYDAQHVEFDYGSDYYNGRGSTRRVRLVRTGE